ncbi:uncharacterized protein LOC116343860 [Contarinia nasturtii]|uniref:uncharacterized protein LOC116343860 n=1 Tax=Contarinia nasturtii TaxID=265458 RepID=UPI0012D3DED9|nr:uncharacterized protein LOC116343860 [Contarinia nasturtii]
MDSDQPFLVALGVVSSLLLVKIVVGKVTDAINWMLGKSKLKPTKSHPNVSIVNLEKKPKSIERPKVVAVVDRLPDEENTDGVVEPTEQIKPFDYVKPKKQKSATSTPTAPVTRKGDLLKRAKRMSSDSFLRIPYDPIFQKANPISETPRKSESNSTLFDKKSPRLMFGKPFSPYNFNKTLSVAEIIEGWPFKSPMKRSINGNRSQPAGSGNSSAKKAITKLSVLTAHEAKNGNEWNKENASDNIQGSAESGGRYPKSLYISPFGIHARRPLNQYN